MTAPITAVVPTRNEEANLPACLAALDWVDEIIVIDAESEDRTVELARVAGARLVVRRFTGWGEQRNHAVALARNDWVLCVDADERVTAELRAAIEAEAARGFPRSGYRVRRVATFAGRPLGRSGWGRDRVLRLYDRRRGAWDDRLVHEKVVVEGPVGELAGTLLHHTARDLFHAAAKERRYAELGALELRRQGRTAGWGTVLLRPALRFAKMFVVDRGFLDGVPGLLVSGLGAYGAFLKYARLWELGLERPDPTPAKGRTDMALSPELLEILACPVCKVAVLLTADGAGLRCEKCRRIYPIRDDIPVMLVDEAVVEEPGPGR